ncbi:MAG TPA: bifunctional DNA-formamidopyrimidine glycosylase/DNA-(apurinic or apyrimidinic site) lyase [Verrucomicrobiae bacterium]|nr:bifunctional DNA-formamidopyrimidine glycosylase/DNA-(apurinic or apyrimidinic site) lyase [Verrucomicrobiae bacterium]
MPELPEVETVRRGLERLIVNKTIKAEEHDTQKGFPNNPEEVAQFLIGATITAVRRRAKVLLIDLSTGYSLLVHLKMTGQMVYVDDAARFGAGHPNDSLIHELPDRSTRVTLTLKEGGKLFFNDQRKFGWMKLLPTELIMETPFMQKVGPEPLEATFTDEVFISRVRRRKNSPIKAALLDQSVLAGIGNIYADEGLWGAKIHPSTLVRDVTDKQLRELRTELQTVLKLAIEKGGSTDRNYVNAEGKKGSYMDFARVFRKENTPCPRCGMTIMKTRVAGRGTHICLHCQPEPQHA